MGAPRGMRPRGVPLRAAGRGCPGASPPPVPLSEGRAVGAAGGEFLVRARAPSLSAARREPAAAALPRPRPLPCPRDAPAPPVWRQRLCRTRPSPSLSLSRRSSWRPARAGSAGKPPKSSLPWLLGSQLLAVTQGASPGPRSAPAPGHTSEPPSACQGCGPWRTLLNQSSPGLEASRPPVLLGTARWCRVPSWDCCPLSSAAGYVCFFDTAAAIFFVFYSSLQSSFLKKHTTKGFPAQI